MNLTNAGKGRSWRRAPAAGVRAQMMKCLSREQQALISATVPLPNGRKVVLPDVGGRKDISTPEYNQNIYCVDEQGNIIWQIKAEGGFFERDSFVSVEVAPDGLLRADRFFGNEYLLDPENGVAEHVGWHK